MLAIDKTNGGFYYWCTSETTRSNLSLLSIKVIGEKFGLRKIKRMTTSIDCEAQNTSWNKQIWTKEIIQQMCSVIIKKKRKGDNKQKLKRNL